MRRTFYTILRRLWGLSLLVLLLPSAQAFESGIVWDKMERGVLYTRVQAEGLVEESRVWVHVYNIDTSRYGLRLFRCGEFSSNGPLSFDEWYRETGSVVLFNACPEVTSKPPRGYVRIDGETVQGSLYEGWKGVLATAPTDGSLPFTKIIDLNFASFDETSIRYRDVLQQPMLVDEKGNLRVSPRDYTATRVAMAEDENRNILVFLTERPCTLWALAQWLRSSSFGVTRAMSLGGGNAPQVLGPYAPERIYITGEPLDETSGEGNGSMLTDLSSALKLSCVLGVEPLAP